MKIFFYQKNKTGNTTYTFELLRYIAKKNGHTLSDLNDSEICALSLAHISEIDTLRIFRKRNPGKKIIVGGHGACHALLRYADYICMGHSFELFRDCKKISDLDDKPYIIHKGKKSFQFSKYIDWDLCPVVRISKNSHSLLYSVGCRKKCKFCYTSWINKYQVNPYKKKIERIRKKLNGQLYLITNDFDNQVAAKRNVSDVRVSEYLKNPSKTKDIKLIRLGIESPCEETRKELGKPISNDDLKEFFRITQKLNQRCNLFFIAGFDGQEEWESMIDLFDVDIVGKPKIGFIVNYFSPQPHTPLKDWDLTKIKPLDLPKIKIKLKIKNARIVIYRDLKVSYYNSTIDAMLSRSKSGQVDNVLMMRDYKNKGLDYFVENAERLGILGLMNGDYNR